MVAKRVIVLTKRVPAEVEELIKKLQEALEKAGLRVDLTPLLQQLRK